MESTSVIGAAQIWRSGLRTGLRSARREPVLGLKRLILPVGYWRAAEFSYVWNQLAGLDGGTLFDLGSPKDLAAFLARDRRFAVVASDILDDAVRLSSRYAAAQGIEGAGKGRVRSEIQDGRKLSHADDSFDACFSVSVLEHIPDRGDTQAIHELVRVTRPGGRIVVTTPFDLRYRETFVNGGVYERQASGGEPVFYERHYDHDTLRDRLLSVPGTRLVDLQLWGERWVPVERIFDRIGPIRTLLSPLEALFAATFLRPTEDASTVRPKAAFFTLEKIRG